MTRQFINTKDAAIVETDKGKIRGYIYDNVAIFKGIPYGQAKRFHKPEPVESWDGIEDRMDYGYVCPVLNQAKPSATLAYPPLYWVADEDCLNLNVWTPACDGEKRPVMVWLHGGAFEEGSSIAMTPYDGANMCREGQVVVVSINHRLNILGYFDVSDFGEEYANSGNAGMDDIILALKWVKKNIAAFGGNPENITLFGQSGGGAKITTLMQMPAADGLYHRAINMSGVVPVLMPDNKGSGKELAEAIMKELGIADIKELEEVPYAFFAAAYRKLKPQFQGAGKYYGGTPHFNAFYAGDPLVNGFRKETAHIPMIVGTVYGEFFANNGATYERSTLTEEETKVKIIDKFGEETAKELICLFKKAYPERPLIDLLSIDYIFREPTQQYIRMRSRLNQCTYSYIFNQDLSLYGGCCPWHCSELPFVFHNIELVPVSMSEGADKLEERIFNCVMAFARTGNPNHSGISNWPVSTPDQEQTMMFDSQPEVRCNHDHELLAKYISSLQW